jgi:pleiotropic regulator 1
MTDLQEMIPKHSVHTLVFRSLKRTHDMFLSDYSHPVEIDPTSVEFRKNVKALSEYGSSIVKMPQETSTTTKTRNTRETLNETNILPPNIVETKPESTSNETNSMVVVEEEGRLQDFEDDQEQEETKSSNELIFNNNSSSSMREPSGGGAGSRTLTLFSNQQYALTHKRSLVTMPKPQWHAPWKLYRVISGHLGWVRCVDVEPGNEWFATGAGDRIIKIWDLASGQLKLSLTGHVSGVRGICVSNRHPYLFSCGEDKQVKCWDLETNKVIRHYHGHLSACYSLALHPALDILVSAGRDSVARMWDMRSKAQIHCLEGHTNTVAAVKCQEVEPQIITASHDSTIRCWDIIAGKTVCTLTNHKKSVRALTLHPKWYSMASASPDNIKEWKFPKSEFIQNLSGHDAILNALASNSDNVLVSAADNGSIYFWDWLTGYNFQRIQSSAQSGSIDSENGVFAMTFDQSGSRLLTCEADKTIKIYKEDENATEESHPVNWKPDILKRKRF